MPDIPPDSQAPGSQPLSNPKHERFALLIIEGKLSAAEAYKQAVSSKCSQSTAETTGPKLARDAQITLRIEWLRSQVRAQSAQKAAATVLTVARKRELLSQFAEDEEQKTTDRIKAIETDAKLAGELAQDKAADKQAAATGKLAQALDRIRLVTHG